MVPDLNGNFNIPVKKPIFIPAPGCHDQRHVVSPVWRCIVCHNAHCPALSDVAGIILCPHIQKTPCVERNIHAVLPVKAKARPVMPLARLLCPLDLHRAFSAGAILRTCPACHRFSVKIFKDNRGLIACRKYASVNRYLDVCRFMGINLVDLLLPLGLVARLVRCPVFQRVYSIPCFPRICTVSKIDSKIRQGLLCQHKPSCRLSYPD